MTTPAPPFPRRLLRAREVAAVLGRSVDWWRKNRRALEEAGFPRPVPGIGLWDPAAIEAWLALFRPGGGRDETAGWEARLAARLDVAAMDQAEVDRQA